MARRKSREIGRRKIHFGVAGLGWFAQVTVLPAFRHASRDAELAAFFSDEPEKKRRPTLRQEIDRPPVGHQEPVAVDEPSPN